ncbi:MAG: DUF4159 domain-containing protein [Pseudomonadota bacterium]
MPGSLSFASPFILFALGALPLVWWLLRASPPSPRVQQFPAFIILRQLKNERETPSRTPWFLLLLRLLLTAFLILGLAGPILNAPAPTVAPKPIALIVDNTFAAAPAWRLRRDAMLAAAAEAEQSGETLYILPTAPSRASGTLEPLTADTAREIALAIEPQPYPADRLGALDRLAPLNGETDLDVRWLSDGLAGADDARFADELRSLGALSVFADRATPKPVLRSLESTANGPQFSVDRLYADGDWEGTAIASAQDGRELARVAIEIASGETSGVFTVDLPLALRNEIAAVRIEGVASAGAAHLIDARERRALVGVVAETAPIGDRLLNGAHYLREALNPYAALIEDSIAGVLDAGVSVIILDDTGTIRSSDVDLLTEWIERGGVLIRFAGPILAEAAQDREPPLLPVPLRGGGRAFGGALTWDTPQTIDAFPSDSPFAGLAPPADALVRRQVLAQPGGETTLRSWARLSDGTPLVTGVRQGQGAIALFHVTATPQWSDLPISGAFVGMLRRLVFLSALSPEGEEASAEKRFAPIRLLDGYGRFRRPTDQDPALTTTQLSEAPGPERMPGLYGAEEAPLALNVIGSLTPYAPLSAGQPAPYIAEPPQNLAPPLFAIALLMLLVDAIATLIFAGKLPGLRLARPAAAASLFAISLSMALLASPTQAQPLDRPIDPSTFEAALTTRLAFVQSGDPALDRLSAQGLAGLSRELYRRTALEPAPPVGVNPETDDLSVYPFLYWPIAPGAAPPSEEALANIENFMRLGGLILFDTRDDERAVGAGSTPEGQALQALLSQLNIPPLAPVGNEHVLTRSFYLVPELYGRLRNNPVWVATETGGANDGVTPVIIGGRDWAGAWATDQFGQPTRPIGGRNPRARELAYRAGVNIIMVAFTGNYKSDQVHTPILLERLGR